MATKKTKAKEKELFIARKLRAINTRNDAKAQQMADRIIRRNQEGD